ncbi:hypothetical protein T492DRAFT_1132040 [Pavlovales sp. CCMP2436]|nr:hypothetical protein T492DRAFT_1132040 [Pavlovales sp. CCMP2436]
MDVALEQATREASTAAEHAVVAMLHAERHAHAPVQSASLRLLVIDDSVDGGGQLEHEPSPPHGGSGHIGGEGGGGEPARAPPSTRPQRSVRAFVAVTHGGRLLGSCGALFVAACVFFAILAGNRTRVPSERHPPIQSQTGDDSWMDGGSGEEGGKADSEGGGVDNASTFAGVRKYRGSSGLLSHGAAAEPEVGEAAAIFPRGRNTPARSSSRRTGGFGGSGGVGGGGSNGSALAAVVTNATSEDCAACTHDCENNDASPEKCCTFQCVKKCPYGMHLAGCALSLTDDARQPSGQACPVAAGLCPAIGKGQGGLSALRRKSVFITSLPTANCRIY